MNWLRFYDFNYFRYGFYVNDAGSTHGFNFLNYLLIVSFDYVWMFYSNCSIYDSNHLMSGLRVLSRCTVGSDFFV